MSQKVGGKQTEVMFYSCHQPAPTDLEACRCFQTFSFSEMLEVERLEPNFLTVPNPLSGLCTGTLEEPHPPTFKTSSVHIAGRD